jgi:MtN3 and saliva related transmembrane protein
LILSESLGLIAGALATCSLIPQVIRVFKLKSAREISTLFTTLLLLGLSLWVAYGVLLDLVPVIIWNATAALFTAILLYGKIRYGR